MGCGLDVFVVSLLGDVWWQVHWDGAVFSSSLVEDYFSVSVTDCAHMGAHVDSLCSNSNQASHISHTTTKLL